MLLERKAMLNFEFSKAEKSLCKQNPYSQSYGFSSGLTWMWELNHNETECWRIDAFKLWCWRRLLRVPWIARRSVNLKGNQSWIFIGKTCWSWSSNTLATWCKEMTYWKRLWYWERLKAGGEGGNRGWDGWMASSIQWTWVWANWEIVKDREAWPAAVHGVRKSWTHLRDWITTTIL